jgi:hypothetical protein
VLVEDKGSEQDLIAELQEEGRVLAIPILPKGDKECEPIRRPPASRRDRSSSRRARLGS